MSTGNATIQRLPEEVAAQIKSSATLTSLEDVIVGLLKNSLDAGSRRIDVSVDFSRGACTVEDDGCGITPEEFLETGGLGKAFHTSKFDTASNLQGREGTFLASLAAVSILKITSHHHSHRQIGALIYHHTRAAARLVPAPSHYQLLNRDHGTKVEVHDIFGNMPVRVKQRGLEILDHRAHSRRWESIRKNLVGLILAWNTAVDLSFVDAMASKKIFVKSKSADHKGATDEHRATKTFDLAWVCSVLSQAGYTEPDSWAAWIKTSARTPFITIRGAFSLHPAESKGTQFISLGIRHIGTAAGANILYHEVNRLFASSSFGNLEVLSDDKDARKLESKDSRYKKDGHTNRQLRGKGKGTDRWPKFVIHIDLQEALSRRFARGDGTQDQNALSKIVKVLGAMVTGFLSDHNFRPHKSRKRRRAFNANPLGSLSMTSAYTPSPTTPKSLSMRTQIEPRTGKSNNDVEFSQDLIGHTIQLPKVKMDRIRYRDEGFKHWSRIKSGTRQDGDNSSVTHQTTSKKGSGLSDDTTRAHSPSLSKGNLSNATVIAQVDKKFILVLMAPATGHSAEQLPLLHDQQILVLIDQHAADERIRVEHLLAELCTPASSDTQHLTSSLGHKPGVATTVLPKPLIFEAKHQEYAMLIAHAQHFAYWGILFDLNFTRRDPKSLKISPCKVFVKCLPSVIAERCRLEPKLLIDVLRKELWRRDEDGSTPMIPSLHPSDNDCAEQKGWLTRISSCPQGILEMLNSRSCRSAIMFNDELSVGECEVLVKKLAKCMFPFQCAHGRPSMHPLVAVGDGLTKGMGLDGGITVPDETDEVAEGFANAWKRWKQEVRG
ncbi:MAG: hypothetical protein Q9210_003783 [Variospora velana]